MFKALSDTSATYPVGIPPGNKIFRLTDGPLAGRIVALYQSSDGDIKLTWADYPYRSWSNPVTVLNDASKFPFDSLLLQDNSIMLIWTDSDTGTLYSRKLSFLNGSWLPGGTVTVHDQDQNYFPVLAQIPGGKVWAIWSRLSGGSYYICGKSSVDGGATWSSTVTISSEATSAFPKVLADNSCIYVFYALNGNTIRLSRKLHHIATFETEETIINTSGLDSHFDAAISQNGKLGVVFDDGQLRFVEYDGTAWSGAITVDPQEGTSPQLQYSSNVPYIIWLRQDGSEPANIVYSRREGTSFSVSEPVDPSRRLFSKVLLYHSGSGTFEDVTSAASDNTTGDVFHTASSALLSHLGDTLYLGMSDRFSYLKTILSIAGTGGTVNWTYFDGQQWTAFVPYSGAWSFSDSEKELLLWQDTIAIPPDWQKCTVQDNLLFWIKVTVTAPFTLAPVGTMFTAIPDCKALTLMES